jgi:hypothetical protein
MTKEPSVHSCRLDLKVQIDIFVVHCKNATLATFLLHLFNDRQASQVDMRMKKWTEGKTDKQRVC